MNHVKQRMIEDMKLWASALGVQITCAYNCVMYNKLQPAWRMAEIDCLLETNFVTCLDHETKNLD